MLDITEIKIALQDDNKLKAFASITLDNCFVIRRLKIIEGASRLFIAMPSRRRKNGTFQDIAHPINKETRDFLEDRVIAAYKEELQRVGNSEIASRPSRYASENRSDSIYTNNLRVSS